jgi:hypothetical protein
MRPDRRGLADVDQTEKQHKLFDPVVISVEIVLALAH